MKILISGSSGFVGSAVTKSFLEEGHQVVRLVRPGGPVGQGTITWSPDQGTLDLEALEGFDAMVHLAGENISARRWNDEHKRRIRDSRIHTTSLLSNRIKHLQDPPEVAVMASAIGYYGDRGAEMLAEHTASGKGFLADLTRDWEAASAVLQQTDIRLVNLRIGMVLDSGGGALARMLPIFRKGLGGRLGSGKQYMSWISRPDLVRIIRFCIDHDSVSGPVNGVAPNPVTNAEFSRVLGRVLGRPAIMPVPRLALRLAMGEMANEILASTRALPEKLLINDFEFNHPDLETALRALLKD